MPLHPTRLFALLLAITLPTACAPLTPGSSPAAASPGGGAQAGTAPAPRPGAAELLARLEGTDWLLEDLAGAGVIDRLQSTLSFPQAGRLAGSGGCNRFMGPARVTDGRLAIGPLVSTRMACAPAAMTQEQRYLGLLGNATGLRLEASWLLIDTPEGALKFTRQR